MSNQINLFSRRRERRTPDKEKLAVRTILGLVLDSAKNLKKVKDQQRKRYYSTDLVRVCEHFSALTTARNQLRHTLITTEGAIIALASFGMNARRITILQRAIYRACCIGLQYDKAELSSIKQFP